MTSAKTPPARPRRRRRVLLPLLALATLLFAAHGVAWTWATGALAVGFSDWVAQRQVEGWRVAHGMPRRAGWPFAAELVVPAFQVEAQGRAFAEPVAFDTARLVLRLAPPRLDRLSAIAEGPHRLGLGALDIPFTAARLEAHVPLEPGPGPRGAELLAEEVVAALPGGPARLQRARLVTSSGAVDSEPALLLRLDAEAVSLPPSSGAPAVAALGRDIAALQLDAALTGPPPSPPSALRAAAWRDAGGALDVERLALRWGPLRGEARMRLALDAALQPGGEGRVRVAGAPAALEAMAAAGLVPPGAVRAAQGIVAVLGRVPPEGGPPEVELPVALTQGRLTVARITLANFAPVVWR